MEIKANSKYDIGEEVWFIGLTSRINGRYKVSNKGIIEGIEIQIYTGESYIFYIFDYGDTFRESDCFKTYEKAQVECDIRNEKLLKS